MTLGASGPTNFDTNSSNLFVEAWVRAISTANPTRIYGRGASISSTVSYDFTFRFNAGSLGVANGTTTVSAPGTVTSGVWYHCALSITTTGLTTVFLNGQAGTPTVITMPYRSTYDTYIGAMTNQYTNGYIRDLRVVQGGIVPTANFTPEAAPFSYNNLPNCVTGSGSTVFTLLSQFFPLYVPGKYGQALYFDNRNAGASAANSYTTYTLTSGTSNSYSMSCWINPLHAIPPTINPNYAVLRDAGGYYSLQNFASSSAAGFYANEGVTGGQGTTFSGLLTTGKWDHHCFVLSNVGATSSNTIVTYYFNGTSKASGNVQRTNGFSNFSALDLGYRFGSANSGAWCSIDDVRLFNTALTSAQVQAVYSAQGMPRQMDQTNTAGTTKTTLTGAPLFSQLSASAVASSVGAFSLRAVNGTTVKAVQVRNGTTSATQDFYADRLGNLLTAPVTGQSLTNWLGGATGYVTTWYDQSGRGNHATQATAANQPIIQKATKGPGYSILFNGTTNYLTGMSYTVLNGTNYSFSLIERRNTNATTLTVISSGSAGADQGLHFQYLTPGTTVRFGQYSDDIDITPYPAYVSNEPLHYWTGTESSTTGRFLYENSVLSVSNVLQTTLLSSTSGNFTIGRRFASQNYFSGEIYEVLVFTKSLYDLDGTSTITQIYQNQLSYTGA